MICVVDQFRYSYLHMDDSDEDEDDVSFTIIFFGEQRVSQRQA